MNKDHKQSDLFGNLPTKKSRRALSEEETLLRREKAEAHTAWKLLKSNKFKPNLSSHQKYLLKKYYSIII